MSDVDYVVFHGDPVPGTGHTAAPGPFRFAEQHVVNRTFHVSGRQLVLQPVFKRILAGTFDGAVLGAELKFPVNAVVALSLALTGRAAVLWGQGYEKAEDRTTGLMRRAGDWLKAAGARSATGYLVYTEGGARQLAAAGVDPHRITVVRNTLDMRRQQDLERLYREMDPVTLRSQLDLDETSTVLLYLGRVYREKRLDELVALRRALTERNVPPVEVVVIGDGPDLGRVRDLAAGIPGLRFVGAIYDDAVLAHWLRVASGVVMPGKVGLAVNHALAHGVPVLTRASPLHAPEVEYIRHEENGLVISGSFAAYVEAVAGFVNSGEWRARLAAGALVSRESLGLEPMVRAFDHGVRRALGDSREPSSD